MFYLSNSPGCCMHVINILVCELLMWFDSCLLFSALQIFSAISSCWRSTKTSGETLRWALNNIKFTKEKVRCSRGHTADSISEDCIRCFFVSWSLDQARGRHFYKGRGRWSWLLFACKYVYSYESSVLMLWSLSAVWDFTHTHTHTQQEVLD